MSARAARLTLAATLGLTLGLGAVAYADDGDIVPTGKKVGKVTLAINTTVADPNTMENVQITGSLLVKTVINYAPNNPCKVLTSYKLGKDVVATGLTSGDPYTVKGKSTAKYNWFPGTPIKGVDHTGLLVVYPPTPIFPGNPVAPGNPIRVHYHVDYDTAGAVSGSLVDYPGNPIINACHPIAQVCN